MRYFFIFLILLCVTAAHGEKITIAVLDLDAKGEGLGKGVADVITESVRFEFGKQKDFDLVAREKMEQLAKEKAIQLSGCTDITCAVKIGKALNVKKMIVGSVGKLGRKYFVFLRAVDVEKENVVCNDKQEGQVNEEDIPSLVPPVVQRLSVCLGSKSGSPETFIIKEVPAGVTFLKVNEQGYGEYKNEIDGSMMIYIPRNTKGYFIDKYEVSNEQYKKFCDKTGRTYPDAPWVRRYLENYPDNPAVNITCEDASDYAAWAGKRLPTEAEWKYAAMGKNGRVYPWGNEWDASKCNASGSFDGYPKTSPVGSYLQGASPFGVMDMLGNAWEWTEDRVRRGGGWVSKQPECETWSASWTELVDCQGFRCVRDIK